MPDQVVVQRRVALVIGNGAYTKARRLVAPPGDAAKMAQMLKGMGFQVLTSFNGEYHDFKLALRGFYDALRGADIGLLYFSGHGVQDGARENYLLPTDANLREPEDAAREAFALRRIMTDMHDRVETGLIFLDACRDNPFDGMPATKSTVIGTGLAKVTGSLGGLLVAFASDEGNVALDGAGDTPSPFTSALLRHLAVPDRPVTSALIEVVRDVEKATNGRQTPWTQTSLRQDVVLMPTRVQREVDPEPPPANPVPPPVIQMQHGSGRAILGGILAVAVVVGVAIWLYLRPVPAPVPDPDPPIVACSTLTGALQMACRVPDLDSTDENTRLVTAKEVEHALLDVSESAADKAAIVRRLLDMTDPAQFPNLSQDGRFNVFARLAAVPTSLWIDPALIVELERAHSTISALNENTSGPLGSQTYAFVTQMASNTGYRPRSTVTVYPQFAGFTREDFTMVAQALTDGWGWTLQALDRQEGAAGKAEVRYGTDAMLPLALLMAAQLSGKVPPHAGNVAADQTVRGVLSAAGLRRVEVARIRMKDGQLELWIGK